MRDLSILILVFTISLASCNDTIDRAASPVSLSSSTPTSVVTREPTPSTPPEPTATEIPPQAPVITVGQPPIAFAGDQIEIPVSIQDPNGDPFEVQISQQLGFGDQYVGGTYVTSQALEQLAYDGERLTIFAKTPGNYRIIITAFDNDGETLETVDVPVTWAPGRNPFPVRGVAIDMWGPPDWHDLAYVPALIDTANELGANYIQLAPSWHVESIEGSVIQSCLDLPPTQRVCTSPTDDEVRAWIQHAHSLGMGVLLKPHLNVGSFYEDSNSYDAESWQLNPADPMLWFESYRDFILHYADIAQEENVEMFGVGNELTATEGMSAQWRNLIAMVRDRYDGQLTYSMIALWTNEPLPEMSWDSLDLIGVPYYFRGSEGSNNPSVEEMVAHIDSQKQQNLSDTMSQFSNPVLATEMGRPNFDGTNYDAWNWSSRTVDNQEQVDWLEAAFISQLDLLPRFQGAFIWVLKPRREASVLDWDFRDKPVADAIELWYSN